ncbi:pentatricopeptide repeat-containing protein At4g21705, mitochondrial [Arachis duranensis]|uniref:Pentatricopeptide repeat-containing protein At4g21705, mitochondrial n=1 Tax=Arachis duranensis TaxID=130453 RepID=A0A6P4CNK5_ARADU|nr:pentatricopeptide repeat-containing protein At4g21705, mitochondrial [Arachis duranensis]XP_015954075.1 pentatricopeptide repeat-containing protein At4g21705, mitochondrial [Arachis duranensis]
MFSAILHKSRNSTSTFLQRSRIWFSSKNQVKTTNRKNLYSRISPLGDPSVSVVPILDHWLLEGHAVKAPELHNIVKDLRSHKRFNQALEVSEWMSSKALCPISAGDQAIQLELIGRVRGLDYAESYFHNLSDQEKTEKLHGALLSCYVREGLVDKSLSHMQKMKEMGFASSLNYNNIMCLYMQTDQHDKVPSVLTQMKEDGVSPDIFSYKVCINSYGARSDLANVERLLEEMENNSCIGTDWVTYSMVANIYIKAGLEEKALAYLKKCEDKADKCDALAYNHLISHYATLRNKKAMMRLWELQKSNCKKQLNREYITMLGSLVKLKELGQAEELLREWESSGNCYDFRVPNILLIAYSQNGLIEKAETILRSMVEKGKTPTPNSWAIIASGYVANKNMEKAFQCMKEAVAVRAENKGWRPKPNIISSILSWASSNGDAEEIEGFVNSLKNVIPMNRDMYLSLIMVSVRCGKKVDGILENMKTDKIELDEEILNILGSRL